MRASTVGVTTSMEMNEPLYRAISRRNLKGIGEFPYIGGIG